MTVTQTRQTLSRRLAAYRAHITMTERAILRARGKARAALVDRIGLLHRNAQSVQRHIDQLAA